MAREATLVIETMLPISVTVADGTAIPKGSILELNDNFTATISNGDTDPVIGIAAEEKIASDGKTQLAVYTRGIFRGYAGAAGATFGLNLITDVATGDTNELVVADAGSEQWVGRALETATDGQTFLFELNPAGVNIA